jgi:hypothetical protein
MGRAQRNPSSLTETRSGIPAVANRIQQIIIAPQVGACRMLSLNRVGLDHAMGFAALYPSYALNQPYLLIIATGESSQPYT